MAKLCLGCMKMKEQSPVCEHCGYNENVPNYPHQLPLGTVLKGQYTVGKVLGQGGFGITYIGWDTALEAPVAIKEYYPNNFVSRDSSQTLDVVCTGQRAEEVFRQNRDRFLREAKILAKLSSVPGIVRVHSLFSENNTAYIVMEYVEGIDLKHYIRVRNRCLTVPEVLSVMAPIMKALSKVHDAELVHRDISPDNIMILPDGSAKLLDFGAAREVVDADVHKDLPQSTEAILKHGFATMFYCLTGKVPNSAPERVMGDDNIRWDQVAGLTRVQMDALDRAMAILPENRIQSMEALSQVLLEGKPLPKQYPVGTVELGDQPVPGVMETKKKKKKPFAAIAAVLAVVAAMGLFTMKSGKLETQSEIAAPQTTVPVTEAPKETLPAEAPEEIPENVLLADHNPAISDVDAHTYYPTYSVFGSDLKRNQISSVTFLDTLQDAPADAWDVSENRDGSVLAWAVKNSSTYSWVTNNKTHYDLYIGTQGKVTAPKNCDYLFAGYEDLVSIQFGGNFDTRFATSMVRMFSSCGNLTSLDLSSFDTRRVEDMSGMFHACKGIASLDLHNFDTARAENFEAMFNYCEGLVSVNLSSFDTGSATDMGNMFAYCRSIVSLDLSNFDTSKVTTMQHMFGSCNALTFLDISSFDTANVTDMRSMFLDCYNLDDPDLSHFDTSSVARYDHFMADGKKVNGRPWQELFTKGQKNLLMADRGPSAVSGQEWEVFKTFPLLRSDIQRQKIMSVTFVQTLNNMNDTAWDVSENMDGSVMAWVEKSKDNSNYYDLYIGAEGKITAPENFSYFFAGYSNVRSIAFNDVLDTSHTTNMSNLFYCCTMLSDLDVGYFDTSNVTDMSWMFSTCQSLWTLKLNNFDTSKVTNMSGMFSACQNLSSLDVSSFDTSNVTTMYDMFFRLSTLQNLDLQHFDTSKVTDMSWMFSECGKLWRLKVGTWETDSVTNYEYFFFPDREIEGQRWQDWFEK